MRPTRFYSNKQEKKIAKAVQGKQTANSGATKWSKGDVRTQDNLFLIEAKTHTEHREQFTIKKAWIDKNEEERFQMGKQYSALAIQFGPDEENYYLISESLFLELLNHLRECENE